MIEKMMRSEVITNAAYMIAGGALLDRAPLVGAALILTGVLSALYHIGHTPEARRLDRLGVLLLVLALLAQAVWPWWVSLLLLPAAGLLAWSLRPMDLYVSTAFGLVIGRLWPGSVLAAAVFLVALAAAAYGERYEDAHEDLRYQVAHGLWHLLSATAIYLLTLNL